MVDSPGNGTPAYGRGPVLVINIITCGYTCRAGAAAGTVDTELAVIIDGPVQGGCHQTAGGDDLEPDTRPGDGDVIAGGRRGDCCVIG